MSIVSAQSLYKQFGTHTILTDASVTLSAGERVGLVGSNGSGKSTLSKILAGLEPPDTGTVMVARGARIGYLDQVPQLDESLTCFDAAAAGLSEWLKVRHEFEDINDKLGSATDAESGALLDRQSELSSEFDRLGGWEQVHRVETLLEHLSVPDPKALVSTLSGGEKRRIGLAQLLVSAPDLLILDEPTNHLDTTSIDWLEQYLVNEFRGGLLIITHDRYFLDRVVERTLELSQGRLLSYEGGWESYLLAKAERESTEARTESNRQNFLRRELEWLSRQPKARGTKQKARIGRAEDAIQKTGPAAAHAVRLGVGTVRQGSSVLELRSLKLKVGERTLIDNLDFTLTPGQRVGVIGRNGTGKTTLLKALTGDVPLAHGTATLGKNARVAYFDQLRSGLDDDKTVVENVAGKRDKVQVAGQDLTIYSYLERFLFRSDDIRKKVGMLSGGERARVALAKLLLQETNLLLLDEPTNDLDVMTLGALEEMLTDFPGCVVVVTHDRYFLNRVVTDLLVFEDNGRVVHYVGNYDTYLSALEANRIASRSTPPKAPAKEKGAPAASAAPAPNQSSKAKADAAASEVAKARAPKLSNKERTELDGIEKAVEKVERQVRELEAKLANPSTYRDTSVSAANLQQQLASAQAEVVRLMARWEELESKR